MLFGVMDIGVTDMILAPIQALPKVKAFYEGAQDAAKKTMDEALETAITTSMLTLAGSGLSTYRSVRAAQDVVSGRSGDVEAVMEAARQDAQDEGFVSAMEQEARTAQIEERTVEVLNMDDGRDGKMAAAQKTQEQADSHRAEKEASEARMENARAAYYERKDSGDIDAANAALMDYAKAKQGLDEHTREEAQKSYEAQQIREDKMQDARRQATAEIAQEAAGAREAVAVQADVIRYESMTGDDSIRQDRLAENMRSKEYANQREDFAEAIDTWDGKQKGLSFVLGRTSQPLASLGVPDADIVIQSDKLEKIKKKHPAKSNEVIKQIPEVVENPIVVMESGTVKDRLTMFGSVMDDAGNPVLAVVAMSPKTNVVTGVNFLEVKSAYGKNTDPQGFIDRSNVLYVDKKRAAEWEVSTRETLIKS